MAETHLSCILTSLLSTQIQRYRHASINRLKGLMGKPSPYWISHVVARRKVNVSQGCNKYNFTEVSIQVILLNINSPRNWYAGIFSPRPVVVLPPSRPAGVGPFRPPPPYYVSTSRTNGRSASHETTIEISQRDTSRAHLKLFLKGHRSG